MTNEEYYFCLDYIGEFINILNFPLDTSDLEMIEEDRRLELLENENKYKSTPMYEEILKSINERYDKQLFDYIKKNVADINPDFLNNKLGFLTKLLNTFQDYAVKYKMNIHCKNINDFYQNYLIAYDLILSDGRYKNEEIEGE